MKVTLYAVTAYGIDLAESWARGLVVTDDRDARGMATAISDLDPVIRTVTVDIPDAEWQREDGQPDDGPAGTVPDWIGDGADEPCGRCDGNGCDSTNA